MITKKYSKDFSHQARTLPPSAVSENWETGYSYDCQNARTHDSGWMISGVIHEDYFYWVNEFYAWHPTFGFVKGDFESEIVASSAQGLAHFLKNHPYEEWDYWDI